MVSPRDAEVLTPRTYEGTSLGNSAVGEAHVRGGHEDGSQSRRTAAFYEGAVWAQMGTRRGRTLCRHRERTAVCRKAAAGATRRLERHWEQIPTAWVTRGLRLVLCCPQNLSSLSV